VGFPGSGYYAASKHAVEGFSDSLLAEAGPLGIKVTCIEPGPFRTDWAGRSMTQTANKIADYADIVGARLKNTKKISGNQPGDPVRAANAIIQISDMADAPRHIVMGAWGVDAVKKRLAKKLTTVEKWEAMGLATDFPEGQS